MGYYLHGTVRLFFLFDLTIPMAMDYLMIFGLSTVVNLLLMPNSPWNFSFGIGGIYRPRKKSLSINILQYENTNSFCFDSGF